MLLPAPTFRKISSFCSEVRPRSGSLSRWLQRDASEICSFPSPATSAKRASAEVSRALTALRSAAETCPSLAVVRASQAACAPSAAALALPSAASSWPWSFASSCLASNQGPLLALAILPSWVARHSLASASAAAISLAAASVFALAVSGAPTEASSASATDVRGAAASSSFWRSSWAFSTFSATALRMREAALRSFFSSCFRRSNSSLLECARLPSSTFLPSWSSLVRRTLIFGRIFMSSILA
mmetsp:Transcript_41740/g.132783  ORF Transcript_41740/g.132783 Transcript_41740/m.132783 type:complete len:244 (-) Transcript_41740:522-1253(-)